MAVCINTAYVSITSLRKYKDPRDRSTGMDEPRYCAWCSQLTSIHVALSSYIEHHHHEYEHETSYE